MFGNFRDEVMVSGYSAIANEYYDTERHPTCANFDELSRKFLEPRLREPKGDLSTIIEVGAGRSIVTQALRKNYVANIILVDSSLEMLSHSKMLVPERTRFCVADAFSTGLPTGCADLLVASLGDPYNTPEFWREVGRLLKDDGSCLFTTPSAEWAQYFRVGGRRYEAEFILRDGSRVVVPSFLLFPKEQREMISEANLVVLESEDYFISDLKGKVSPKLASPLGSKVFPVLRGFTIERAR
jgi:ubiquinone/menaquinone biosynthesis C-methylase UbiE